MRPEEGEPATRGRTYDRTARILHWVSAVFFIAALVIGLYFSTLNYRNDEVGYAAFLKVIHWHKTFGLFAFLLVFYRLYHRWRNPPPALPAGSPAWMRAASWLSHATLYALIVVLGVTGLVASDIGNYAVRLFSIWKIPQFPGENRELADAIFEYHMWLGDFAAFLVGLHIAASLYHHFIARDDVLTRMLPGRRR